jgi:hypothetical protein
MLEAHAEKEEEEEEEEMEIDAGPCGLISMDHQPELSIG